VVRRPLGVMLPVPARSVVRDGIRRLVVDVRTVQLGTDGAALSLRRLVISHADLTAADFLRQAARLQSARYRLPELLVWIDHGQPEAERRRVVVTRADAVALYERRRAEGFQARAGGVESLTCSLASRSGVL